MPLLNYQPALYQQATINIPGLTQSSIPLQSRPPQLCGQNEPFQQTLIVCPPTTIQGKKKHCKAFYFSCFVFFFKLDLKSYPYNSVKDSKRKAERSTP